MSNIKYQNLVYSETENGVECVLWLVTQTPNIFGYSPLS